jgi:hypothetical protein
VVSESTVTFSLKSDGRRSASIKICGAAAEFGGTWECDIAELSVRIDEKICKTVKCIQYLLLKISNIYRES